MGPLNKEGEKMSAFFSPLKTNKQANQRKTKQNSWESREFSFF
jgi:hypothetical protein